MWKNKIDLTNQKFGKLTVIKDSGKRTSERLVIWLCKCDCGNELLVQSNKLIKGKIQDCGCATQIRNNKKERLYGVWQGMKQRCLNPNNKDYSHYGGKGIGICKEWINDYFCFRSWAYANGYDDNAPRGVCTLDRINTNGNYEPSNCRWVNMKTQSNNRSFKTTIYKLVKDGKEFVFNSEKQACQFLNAPNGTISSCLKLNQNYKGYSIIRLGKLKHES